MELSRLLMRHVVGVTVLGFALALLAALWQAHRDVAREAEGAARTAEIVGLLVALGADSDKDGAREVEALRRISDSDALRHLELRLVDDAGRVLVEPRREPSVSFFGRLFGGEPQPLELAHEGRIQRADGRSWHASLMWNPRDEQREVREALTGLLSLLLAFSALVLAGIWWGMRRSLKPLGQILDAIARFERRDYAYRLKPMPARELDAIARALNLLAGTLARVEAERRTLSLQVLGAQEEERVRLARELHDEFGQVLTAMRADATYLTRKLAHDPASAGVAQDLANHCERIQLEVRDLLQRLRPQARSAGGEALPLRQMIEELVQAWRDRPGQQVAFEFECEFDDGDLPDALGFSLYRMTQEALTNAMRHAGATRVAVRLRRDAGGLVWTVEDDGAGLPDPGENAAPGASGNGIAGIRERAWAHGGHIELAEARAGAARPGLRVTARFLLQAAGAA